MLLRGCSLRNIDRAWGAVIYAGGWADRGEGRFGAAWGHLYTRVGDWAWGAVIYRVGGHGCRLAEHTWGAVIHILREEGGLRASLGDSHIRAGVGGS